MNFNSKLLNGLLISAVSISLLSCADESGNKSNEADSTTHASMPVTDLEQGDFSFEQNGSVLIAQSSLNAKDINYAWEINGVVVSYEDTLDISTLNVSPIQTVTLHASDGNSIVSKESAVTFNNPPVASITYDYKTQRLNATSIDIDGDTLTHNWMLDGVAFNDVSFLDVSKFRATNRNAITLTSSDSEYSSSANIYDDVYYDFKVQEKVYGQWLASSGQDPHGIGNPVYKITINDAGSITLWPKIISDDVYVGEHAYLYLLDSDGVELATSTYGNSIQYDLPIGEYYLTVGTAYEKEYQGKFEINFFMWLEKEIEVELFREAGYDEDYYIKQPEPEISLEGSVATAVFEEVDGREFSYKWYIDNEVISETKILNLSLLHYVGEKYLMLEVTVAGIKNGYSDVNYDFGNNGNSFLIAGFSEYIRNSGIKHPLSLGNDIYELNVLESATFLIIENNSGCMYFDGVYTLDETYNCDEISELTLDAGVYEIIIGGWWPYEDFSYDFEVYSNVENSATLTLKKNGVDTGAPLGDGELVVADYIANAVVCLDVNENVNCDVNEIKTITDNVGGFYLFANDSSNAYPGYIIAELNDANFVLRPFYTYDKIYINPISNLLSNYEYHLITNNSDYSPSIENTFKDKMNLEYVYNTYNYLGRSGESDDYGDGFKYNLIKIVAKIIYQDLLEIYKDIPDEINNRMLEGEIAYAMMNELDNVTVKIINELSKDTPEEDIFNAVSFNIDANQIIKRIEGQALQKNSELFLGVYGHFSSYFNEFDFDLKILKNIDFSYNANDWGGHHNKLNKDFENGFGDAHMVLMDTGQVNHYIHGESVAGIANLLDLSSEFSKYENTFPDYAVKQGQNHLGQQMAIPIDLGPGVAFYRRDYMEDLNFDIDTVMNSWESFINYGETLRDDHGVFLISNAANIARTMIYGNTTANTGVFTHNNQILVETTRFKDAFALAKQIRDSGLDANTGIWNDDWYDGFRNGTFAMEFQGAWLLQSMSTWISADTTGLWGASNLPNGLYSSWGGVFAAIPTYADNKKDEAWKAIEFMIDSKYQLAGYKQWGMFPANKNTYSDAYLDEPVEYLNNQPAKRLFAEIAENIAPTKPGEFDFIAEKIVINDALEFVLNGDKSIDEALKDAADELAIEMNKK